MKHKAILCTYGGIQQWVVKYLETYYPVVILISERSLLALSSRSEFPRRPIDFVLDFLQVDLYVEVFVNISLVIDFDGNRGEWLLKLNKLLYGLKTFSADLFDLLNNGIKRSVYCQSQVDNCIFYKNESVIFTYADGCVIVSHKQDTITSLIEWYVLTDEGDISNYLKDNIKKNS